MHTDSATLAYFSPTGTTKKILEGIAGGLKSAKLTRIDLTLPRTSAPDIVLMRDDLAVIGVPVYGGRVPGTALPRLRRLRGDATPAVLVAVYGNRAYEDALLELSALVRKAGFIPVAAGAFIGEHSYSTAATPIAVGRPDARDLAQASDFGTMVRKKMEELCAPGSIGEPALPGNFPYRDYGAWPDMAPVTREDLCNLCGECAAVCPTAAITVDRTVLTDKKLCIRCCACVKTCPLEARVMDEPAIRQIAQWLSTNFGERKAPEFFL